MKTLYNFLITLSIFSLSSAELWNAEDALILEIDAVVQNASLPVEEDSPSTVIPSDTVVCMTNEGVQGSCIRFSECYPYYMGNNIIDTNQPTVAGQIQLIRNTSTPCQPVESTTSMFSPGGESINAGGNDEYICCATLSRAISSDDIPLFDVSRMKPEEEKEAMMEKMEAEVKGSCGVTPYTNEIKVVRGREAKTSEFPWAVALFQNGRHHCGASLIDAQHVVTAAHCVNNIRTGTQLQTVRLYIGAHDIYTPVRDFEVRKVKKLAFHKGFDGTRFRDDIALLRMETPVAFSSKVKAICLDSGNPPYDAGDKNADIAGWGKISEHGPPSRKLRTASIRVWTNPQCSQKYQGTLAPQISAGMLCAGTQGMDSCQGDSGGPLTINRGGKEHLIGIVSWGIGCGKYPGVYTRVDKYTSWIQKYKRALSA